MTNTNIKFNQKFLDIFSTDELEDIIDNAISFNANCIIIATETHFFELSADMGNELDIYCDGHSNDTAKKLRKDEFMKLYKSGILMNSEKVNMNA